ncbi:class I SAM-dependent methyltransferase [Marinilongibacter aquaticus]|uniref:class I SAM-dependent methyltransferase n=1 Tax=Marinilongibacter aquaticus TaxID=2975157 RepID=UPI0021BDACD3|nr:class I SAM-dependent methyltransferase [Marinilongibacter aquaticus]UBM59547.1 class I SAM-dependent methyltransferase [Marinilongibacter aquaticus]
MEDFWLKRWNTRYSKEEYAFGEEPNEFLKAELPKYPSAHILFAAEGEGRNAVFAAKQNWEVAAFDISEEGRKKALKLAEKHHVSLDYRVGQLPELDFQEASFDAVALIYAHFPAEIKSSYHKMLGSLLKEGGLVFFEAFSKKHLEYRLKNEKVGGPKDLASLFSIEEIQSDFEGFETILLKEEVIELNEGLYHQGLGSVIRYIGRKK